MNSLESFALKYKDKVINLLDQTQLPDKEVWIEVHNIPEMVQSIKEMKVRGANLLALAALTSILQLLEKGCTESEFSKSLEHLSKARRTAVVLENLILELRKIPFSEKEKLTSFVKDKFYEDIKFCEKISNNGQKFIEKEDNILTYCNTGSLATTGIGTALGVIKRAFELKNGNHVYVCETRPFLQGSRLTFWELQKFNVPSTLICDNAVGYLMQERKINKVIVGADRIMKGGDVINKVGTYSLAVLAHHHKVPFYVAAPSTAIDNESKQVEIEERSGKEVSEYWNSQNSLIYNPAFDITPNRLVTNIITEN